MKFGRHEGASLLLLLGVSLSHVERFVLQYGCVVKIHKLFTKRPFSLGHQAFLLYEWTEFETMSNVSTPRTADKILLDEFLVARSKILEIAATLDRLDMAPGDVGSMQQMQRLKAGIEILQDSYGKKAERVQLLMSREYDPCWRTNLNVDAGRLPAS